MSLNHSETDKSPETQDQLISRINGEVADFFDTKPIDPCVIVYDSKEDLDKAWIIADDYKHEKAPEWLTAFATYTTVNILSQNIMPPWGKGEYTIDGKTRFKLTLKHEFTHIYMHNINPDIPSWLNEGVALVVADQEYGKMNLENITIELLDELHTSTTDERLYRTGFNVVNLIKDGFGQEKIRELILIRDKDELYPELQKMFDWLK